jgi:amino acid transporter
MLYMAVLTALLFEGTTTLYKHLAPHGATVSTSNHLPDLEVSELEFQRGFLTAETQKPPPSQLAQLDRDVEARSAVFKKELGLFDLVLTQIVFVVGTIWVGAAAKLGHSQVILWSLAILTFYLPLAAVVIYLNRLMPLEGGLYQWAKFSFNEFVAFMVAWNLWIFGILILSGIGLVVTTNVSYAIGPSASWMQGNKWFITIISCVLVAGITAAALRGLALGKWVHNAGGVMLMATFLTLILLPFLAWLAEIYTNTIRWRLLFRRSLFSISTSLPNSRSEL